MLKHKKTLVIFIMLLFSSCSDAADEHQTNNMSTNNMSTNNMSTNNMSTQIVGNSDSSTMGNYCVVDNDCNNSGDAVEFCIDSYCRSAGKLDCESSDCIEGSFCVNNLASYCNGCKVSSACLDPSVCNSGFVPSQDCIPGTAADD